MLAAAILTLGINIEIDFNALYEHYQKRHAAKPVCGIKVVGYHIVGTPGQQFGYAGETFTIPAERSIEVISLPHVKHYTFNGQELPLDGGDGPMDAFSIRWITLPQSSEKGESTHE